MLPCDMNAKERQEYPQGRCGMCGLRIDSHNEWEGDDYGYDLLCWSCGPKIQKDRHDRRRAKAAPTGPSGSKEKQ